MGFLSSDLTRATSAPAGRLDDGVARGMELVLTPTLLGLIGFGLDRVLGVVPVLTIALALFGIVGIGVRSYYRYDTQMKALEEAGPWAARQAAAPPAPGRTPLLRDEPARLPTGVRL